jgi:plastocyanin
MKMNKTLQGLRYFLPAILIVISLLALVGCGGTSGAAATQTGTGNSVDINGSSFSPATLTVKVGTAVTWTNRVSEKRSVASDTYVFTSFPLEKGNSYSYTFDKAGTYAYHCTKVASIAETLFKGTIIVEP